jgi:hypothetical protein
MKGIQFPTHYGGNQSQEAGNGEAARPMLGDNDGGLWWSSATDDYSNGGGDNVRPSSKQ